jgi:hypothetical protein
VQAKSTTALSEKSVDKRREQRSAPTRPLRWFSLIAALVLSILTISAVLSAYELRPQVQPVAEFDARAPLTFSFEISNYGEVQLQRVTALCNVSLVADHGGMIDDAQLLASPTMPIRLAPAGRTGYVCRANVKTARPQSVHLAVFVNYEQHLVPGHPWKRTVWIPFHVVMQTQIMGHWVSGN